MTPAPYVYACMYMHKGLQVHHTTHRAQNVDARRHCHSLGVGGHDGAVLGEQPTLLSHNTHQHMQTRQLSTTPNANLTGRTHITHAYVHLEKHGRCSLLAGDVLSLLVT